MAVSLVFEDETSEGQKLVVFKNIDNRCLICTGQIDSGYYEGWITLGSNDLTILICELQSIKAKIDSDE